MSNRGGSQVRTYTLWLVTLFALLLSGCGSPKVTYQSASRPPILILCEGLTLEDVSRISDPSDPLLLFAKRASAAAMNCATGPGPKREAVGRLLATGRREPRMSLPPPLSRPNLANPPAKMKALALPGMDFTISGQASLIGQSYDQRIIASDLVDQVLRLKEAVVIDFALHLGRPDLNRLTNLLHGLEQRNAMDGRNVLLAGYNPPPGRMGALLVSGPGFIGGELTSATTRTPGVVSLADVHPTLRTLLGEPELPGLDGHPITRVDAPLFLTAERRSRLIAANARSLIPVTASLAVFGVLAMVFGLMALYRRPAWRPAAMKWILVTACIPPSALFSAFLPLLLSIPSLDFVPVWASFWIWMAVLGTIAVHWQRRYPTSSLLLGLAGIWVVLIALDTALGQPLMKTGVLSEGAGQGFRFYGIGNEFMGILVGSALVWLCWAGRLNWNLQPVDWIIVLGLPLLLGLPFLGADAGGMIGATVALGCSAVALRKGKCSPVVPLLLGILGVFGALLIGWLEAKWNTGSASHLGGTVQTGTSAGWEAVAAILVRKAEMSWRIVSHPFALAIGAVTLLVSEAIRGWHLRQRSSAASRAWLAISPGCRWGALATVAANDSGAIGALVILGAEALSGLYLALEKSPNDRPTRKPDVSISTEH